jgi:hypothetical protein
MENSIPPTMGRAIKVTLVSLCNAFILASALLWPFQAGLSQTAALIPNAKQVFLNVNGAPLAGGSVFSYVPNTTVPKTTWSDPNQANPNTAPVTLDAGGGAFIFGQGNYRQIVKDVNGNTIWDGFTSAYGSSAPSGSSGTDTAPVGTILPWAGFNFNVPTNWQLAYGQALSRSGFPQLLSAITISTTTGNCVSSSTTLSGFSDTSQLRVGSPIEASCLPTGDTVATIVNATTVTVAVAATATGTFTVTAFPWGNGDGVTTFNLPDLRGRVLPGADAMGGTAAARLTSAFYGSSASPPGVAGGGQSQTASTSLTPGVIPTINSSASNTINVSASGFNIAAANTPVSNALGPGTGGGNYAFSNTGSFTTLTSISSSGANTINVASTNTGGGSPPAATSASFSVVQPSLTMDYIIKVTPNTTGAGGVTSFGGMFGDIICASTLTCGPVGSPAVNTVGCTTATSSQLGCVEPDNSTITVTAGVLSSHGAAQNITVGTTNVFNGPGVLYNSSSGGALQALAAVSGGVLSFAGSTLQASTALPNGVTATTQGAADSSAKVATDAFVENEISRNFATPPAFGSSTPNSGSFTGLTATSITDSGISGSTQCVQANSSGVLSGTSAACGLVAIASPSVLANVSGSSAVPGPTSPAAAAAAGFTGALPCGWRQNMAMQPGTYTGTNTTTFKFLVGPAYFVLCNGAAWIHSPATDYATGGIFLSTIGQGGTGSSTGLVEFQIGLNSSNGCNVATACVSTSATQGGLDAGDHFGALLANSEYHVYLVARDPANAPNDWGLVFSLGINNSGSGGHSFDRPCTAGPTPTVTAIYPYFACIDWFWTDGTATVMNKLTCKQDHIWNFCLGTVPTAASGTTSGSWSNISLTPSSTTGIDDDTGTAMFSVYSPTAASTVQVSPSTAQGTTGPPFCWAKAISGIAGYAACPAISPFGSYAWMSTDSAGIVYFLGGISGF